MEGWTYYNYAVIPVCAPHEVPNVHLVENGNVWSLTNKGLPLLARWTTDFDCGHETNWWYVIKDAPFDIGTLKAKRRYEIKKGCRNFRVTRLERLMPYAEELYEVQVASFSAYPEKYRPTVDRQSFINSIRKWDTDECYVYGAFSCKDGRLCGYAHLSEDGRVLHFSVLKTRPDYESLGVNAAIVYKILEDFADLLDNGYYICDGARNILHETEFQAYLEKYFGFRKAYCRLHIVYNPKIKWLILLLYRFKNVFQHLDRVAIVHKMNGVFLMQEIIEKQDKQ